MKPPIVHVQSAIVRQDGTIEIRLRLEDLHTGAIGSGHQVTLDFQDASVLAEKISVVTK